MHDEPNKPAGQLKDDKATEVESRQAVRNQGEVRPEDYPEPAGGKAGTKEIN